MIILLSILSISIIIFNIPELIKLYKFPTSENIEVVYNFNRDKINNTNPNIILIIVDDLGINDLSDDITPKINSIKNKGYDFVNAYSASATCSPSRAAMFTGKYPTKMGVEFTPHGTILDFVGHFEQLEHPNIINLKAIMTNPSVVMAFM